MRLFLVFLLTGIAILSPAVQADTPQLQLTIRNQDFSPDELHVPAGQKVLVVVSNEDDLPAEFESYDLSREVVVPGHSQVKIYLGPLDPGRYRFFNDFHPASEGWVVATAPAQ